MGAAYCRHCLWYSAIPILNRGFYGNLKIILYETDTGAN